MGYTTTARAGMTVLLTAGPSLIVIVPEAAQGVQAWDRYCFVSNNPLTYIDPTGKYGVAVHYYMTYNLMYTRVSQMGAARGWTDAQIKQVASSMAETVAQADVSVDNKRVVHGADGDYIEKIDSSVRSRIRKGGIAKDLVSQFIEDPHKMKFDDAANLAENANDLESLGEALHSIQDFYSHRMKSWT